MLTAIVAPGLLALALSLVIVPLCRLVALRFGFIARPREDRWNKRPVALFGGVGIAIACFVCAAAFGVVREMPCWWAPPSSCSRSALPTMCCR